MTTDTAAPPFPRVAAGARPRTSLVLAVGPGSTAGALAGLLRVLAQRPALELVVVEEAADVTLRERLAACPGNVRVRHNRYPLGTRAALAAGTATATGEVVVLVADDAVVTERDLDALLVCFADPGVGLAELDAGAAQPAAVAIRRAALSTAGGPGLLASDGDVPADTDDGTGIGLVDHRLASLLAAYGWRRRRVPARGASPGTVPLWPRIDTTSSPTSPAVWEAVRQEARLRPGVNLIGLLEAVCGIGDAARLYAEALEAAEVPFTTFSWHGHGSARIDYEHRGERNLAYNTNLLAMNADVLQIFARFGGREVFQRRRNIGLWFWELEELHPRLLPGFSVVHELWASTGFLRDVFARHTGVPVVRIPLPVRRREGTPTYTRAELGMPEAFCFLVVFDFNSIATRKNSMGAIEAFCRAFEPGEGPVLLLKTSNAAADPAGWQRLQRATKGRRDIVILDANLSEEAIASLVGCSDCVVSLHRAEGFGLVLADAMAWGRPVIATGYSGNLDFMTEENSFLVRHGWSRVPGSLGHIYPAGARWAEPDLEAAAAAMRHVFDDRAGAEARGRRGQADIRRTNSLEAAAGAIAERLGQVRPPRTTLKDRQRSRR